MQKLKDPAETESEKNKRQGAQRQKIYCEMKNSQNALTNEWETEHAHLPVNIFFRWGPDPPPKTNKQTNKQAANVMVLVKIEKLTNYLSLKIKSIKNSIIWHALNNHTKFEVYWI